MKPLRPAEQALAVAAIAGVGLLLALLAFPVDSPRGVQRAPHDGPALEPSAQDESAFPDRQAAPSQALETLFGVVAAVPELAVEELPDTQLDLALLGVFVDAEPGRSSALIVADGEPRRVFIGQAIASARLVLVHPHFVVLERGGKPEALRFERLERLSSRSLGEDG